MDSLPRAFWNQLGTARGFVAFGFFLAANVFALAWGGVDVTPLTGPVAAIVGGVYGSGLLKFVVETRNGKT